MINSFLFVYFHHHPKNFITQVMNQKIECNFKAVQQQEKKSRSFFNLLLIRVNKFLSRYILAHIHTHTFSFSKKSL